MISIRSGFDWAKSLLSLSWTYKYNVHTTK